MARWTLSDAISKGKSTCQAADLACAAVASGAVAQVCAAHMCAADLACAAVASGAVARVCAAVLGAAIAQCVASTAAVDDRDAVVETAPEWTLLAVLA